MSAGVYEDSPPSICGRQRLRLSPGPRPDHLLVQLVATAAVVASALLTYAVVKRVASVPTALLAAYLAGFAPPLPTLDGDLLGVDPRALPRFVGALLPPLGGRPLSSRRAGALRPLAPGAGSVGSRRVWRAWPRNGCQCGGVLG